MKLGFVGSYGTAQQVLTMGQEAEAHGWDGFFTWDGISVGPMDTWDPWTLLGALAVSTERIRLGAMIFPLARRRPWKVARESITVDHLSDGRLVMPVGLGAVDDGGFSRVSGEAATARERAERLDEALAILERAWTGEPFSYSGTHHELTDLVFRPRPVQQPRVPVWVVGSWLSERSMGRAARWDGLMPQRRGDPLRALEPEEVRAASAWVQERRARLAVDEPDRYLGPYDVVVEGVLPEDPEEAVERLQAFGDAGATWWIESRWDLERDTPEVLLDRIRQGPPAIAPGAEAV
jgi:alkanesulfonate monooxygenase SsuD/methylene tetrahydromethanopterin reductase-like flavin-dependent oxidoreductase (luciferase family)